MDLRPLDNCASAAPQLQPDELAAVRAAGYVGVINNRPDDEEPGQPTSAEMAAAAAAHGLAYAHVPLGREPLSRELVMAMRRAMDTVGAPAVLFCRSGTRSTTLWALAEAANGRDADELTAHAAKAGYDLSPYRAMLISLAGAG
ncbi:TIGR01244 family phosphatase [Pacificimonas sp. WHA3]|uniref:TIGR01244 family phosphatase n=1 Tax=Pacificimonas pallii TaxID=2827236 RepID=A0ABS6SBY7_9SPHN|nr:TIGR01244 family sulfur transferase [Pacificimonas pallii]MBV7255935.1 TIGR01244 family phosphatase [Pacificimonas pallii]